MVKRTWKEHLLSSGVPLEHSVATILESLGMSFPAQFKYERANAAGVPTIFSIDVAASHVDTDRDLWLELLAECKYRHDGTRWVFTPSEFNPVFQVGLRDAFVTLDQVCTDRKVNGQLLNSFSKNYVLCERGIELLPEDSNPKTIEQAVQQLRYAVTAKAVECVNLQVHPFHTPRLPIYLIVPVIVTTAELWVIKRGASIEEIRAASELAEIADQHDLVFLSEEPDNLARQSTHAAFRGMHPVALEEFQHSLSQAGGPSFESFLQRFANHPSLFVVVRYTRLREAIGNLIRFSGRPDFVLPQSAS